MPEPSPKFWDRIAAKYAKSPVADQAAYEKKLAITRGYFQPDWEIFEFGCGTGSTAIVHAPYVKHILATDISSNMIGIAEGKAADAGIENITFEVATIESFDCPERSFDAVLGLSILHLLEDRQAAIEQIFRMLKPGGVFVSSTACLGDHLNWIRPLLWIGRLLGRVPFVQFFTADKLRSELTDAGFVIDRDWQPAKNKAVFIVAKKPIGD